MYSSRKNKRKKKLNYLLFGEKLLENIIFGVDLVGQSDLSNKEKRFKDQDKEN